MPDGLRVTGGVVQPGAHIEGAYVEKDGRNLVTSLEVFSTVGIR